jgi:hypothetical protein
MLLLQNDDATPANPFAVCEVCEACLPMSIIGFESPQYLEHPFGASNV